MANYNLVIDSTFKPFSYQEMLAPVMMAQQAHQAIEDEYAELSTKANIWDEMASEQSDPLAYQMYKKYSDDLSTQADLLANEGLNVASRKSMLDMKRRYSSEITPIEQAYTRRKQLADEQRKALASDPTMMYERYATAMSLDDFIRNPELDYGKSYSGKLLTAQVSTAAKAMAKEMRDNPRTWNKVMNNQYWESMVQKGYRPEEIILAATNDENAPKELKKIVSDAIGSSRVEEWADASTVSRAYDYARQGLWDAVGETSYQVQSNKEYDYNMQNWLAEEKRKRESSSSAEKPKTYRAVPKTQVNPDVDTSKMQKDIDYIRSIRNNPTLLDKKSTRFISPQVSPTTGAVVIEGRAEEYYPNKEKNLQLLREYGAKNLDELEQILEQNIRSSAVRSFLYKPNITQSDLIADVIKQNAISQASSTEKGTTGLYEYKSGKRGDQLSLDDVGEYFLGDSDLTFDPEVGFILNTVGSKGEVKSMVLDPEIIDDSDRNVKNYMNNIEVLLSIGNSKLASEEIESLMNYLDGKFNTLVKRQSNTSSKD